MHVANSILQTLHCTGFLGVRQATFVAGDGRIGTVAFAAAVATATETINAISAFAALCVCCPHDTLYFATSSMPINSCACGGVRCLGIDTVETQQPEMSVCLETVAGEFVAKEPLPSSSVATGGLQVPVDATPVKTSVVVTATPAALVMEAPADVSAAVVAGAVVTPAPAPAELVPGMPGPAEVVEIESEAPVSPDNQLGISPSDVVMTEVEPDDESEESEGSHQEDDQVIEEDAKDEQKLGKSVLVHKLRDAVPCLHNCQLLTLTVTCTRSI